MEQVTIKLYKTEVQAGVVFNVTLFDKTFRLAKDNNGVLYASYMPSDETRHGTTSFSVAKRGDLQGFFREIAQDNPNNTKDIRALRSFILSKYLPL